ncbi:hypothetical protein M378DRAFT_73806 [Amanita muscaria Koide BX008]|uniref:Uncharacterized protein n=1 Tax=Amanita muscaria (strain Koide BX008) TaxID=946122 RepID=A0A0C2XCR8_AMAMK|nr:hypothetical protein M378DRAFT_73806 [Amanita muscaria Koide BX008]
MTAPLVVHKPPPFDESLYSLDEDELAFFKSATGIDDEGELKKHILTIQARAYEVVPYPCILLYFEKLRIVHSPFYGRALQIAKEHKDPIFLDVGCNLGTDLRKAVADGWPIENVVGFDLEKCFWNYGHELLRTNPETYPPAFVAGDVFDPLIIAPREPFYKSQAHHDLTITSLTPLQGFVTVIRASAFFHLFSEEQQLKAGQQLASLLSPDPGSIIFGLQGGLPAKGTKIQKLLGSEMPFFGHSPESWRDFWDGQVFAKGTVHVEVELKEHRVVAPDNIDYLLEWCVTRV